MTQRIRTWKRAGAMLCLGALIALFAAPVVAIADQWYGQFVRDSNYFLDVNCKVGCMGSSGTPGYSRIVDAASTNTATVLSDGRQAMGVCQGTNCQTVDAQGNARIRICDQNSNCGAISQNETQVTTGGSTYRSVNTTACTNIFGGQIVIHRIWSAAPSETATLQIYDESGNTCAAADLLWSGIPSTTPAALDVVMKRGITYKWTATPVNFAFVSNN